MKTFIITIGCIALLFTFLFGINAIGLVNLKFWGVKYEDARTEIYQRTKAYKHGTIRDIENICLEIDKAESATHKQLLRSTLNHRISAFKREDIPNHLLNCIN